MPSWIGGPALRPSLRAHWYNETVHLVDLHRTILDLAGVAIPAHPAGVMGADGYSLVPLLNGSAPLTSVLRCVISTTVTFHANPANDLTCPPS